MSETAILILAAGDGKRMKSAHPKALCQVLFKPMISWVLDACNKAGYQSGQICVVCGKGGEELQTLLPEGTQTVWQNERLGTGHAAMQTEGFLRSLAKGAQVMILFGDAPFINEELIINSRQAHLKSGAKLTVIAAQVENPKGYGRIVRDEQYNLLEIVEERDATAEQKTIREVFGAMWADVEWLLSAFPRMKNDNAQKEYYLTDCAMLASGDHVKALAYVAPDSDVILGANSRADLLKLNQIAARRILEKHMANGVEVLSSDGVLIGAETVIGAGTAIYPGTILKGKTVIGTGCTLGPNTVIENSSIGDGCTINASQIEDSILEENVSMGPFAHIRPGSHIGSSVHLGNFTEVKNSNIGARTAVSHLTYVGDSDVGEAVNFGCGCVTVNYDGMNKHRTVIGDHAFIGCNTNLVAPVKVGDFGFTAAGSTITQDVPDNALAIERGEQYNKPEWSKGKIKMK
jgi:bifunctional UDP-N-acetylglucosamine pyrophosphorylase/glucosamine-1-phosphate N-acetyltransferase